MAKVLVFGNSGSGKTTLASKLEREFDMAHLDLDTLAWLPGSPPQRRTLAESKQLIREFTSSNKSWVVEGCYTDLLQLITDDADQAVLLDIPVESCVDNARYRPFEPHKYSSEAAQNHNLAMLVQWIQDYPDRKDTCSSRAHKRLLRAFKGPTAVLSSREEIDNWKPV